MIKIVGVAIALLQFVWAVQCIDLDLMNKEATYLDGKVGSYAVFNCPLDFPQEIEIPYTLVWNKEVTYNYLLFATFNNVVIYWLGSWHMLLSQFGMRYSNTVCIF